MIRVAYNNLVLSIERWYYQHGIYCSSNAYRIISFTCFIIALMSIGILYSPLVYGNAVVEWRSKDNSLAERHSPQWLDSPPLASVQHFMLQLKHDTPFEAIQTMFTIQKKIISTKIQTPNGPLFLSDVCFKATSSSGVVNGLPNKPNCLFLSPTQFWNGNLVDFLSDPDIADTLLGDDSSPNLRALMFGTSWTTPPHPITLTLFLSPSLSSAVVSQFRETILSQLSDSYSLSILTEQEFKTDYMFVNNDAPDSVEAGRVAPDSAEVERVHLFYSDKIVLMQLMPLAGLYVLVFIYIVFSVRKITLVKSKVGLACVAVATIVFSFVMSLGFCVFFNLLPTLTGGDIFPYIFTLVGLENVLTITRSVTITAGDQEVHIRVAQGLSMEGTKITKNVCGVALMFLVGIFTPVPAAFQEFCVIGLVCVICDFFLQLFFFVPVLSLDIRRLELADLKSASYPAPSTPVNGKLPDWTDRPRKTKIFRHRATHKILMISVFLYVCYVIYQSLWSPKGEKNNKKISMRGIIAVYSTRIINWFLSMEYLQPQSTGGKSLYEDMFPHTFLATGSTVDMLDQSWRRVARDNWPLLFKQYDIVVTARYFDVYKPIYVEEKNGIKIESVTFQSQVRQWLHMPFTLHLISTLLGFVSFLPIAVLLYLSFIGISKLLTSRPKTQSVGTKQNDPILEVPYVLCEHKEDIEHVTVCKDRVLTTSFDAVSILWDLARGTIKLKITSETIPWWTALSDSAILLGHSDGSVNVVEPDSRKIITIHQHNSGIVYLQLLLSRTALLCHDNGTVLVVDLPVSSVAMATSSGAGSNKTTDSKMEDVTIKCETRIYPGSLVEYCADSRRLAVCGGSNVVKVYDALTLRVYRVLQLPNSLLHLHLHGDILLGCNSAIFLTDLTSPDNLSEFEITNRKIKKILSNEDCVIGHCCDGSILIWDIQSNSSPQLLDVKALDICLLLERYVFALEADSVVLWSLQDHKYVDNISLTRYVSLYSNLRLRSSKNVAFVLDGSSVVPLLVLNK